MLHVRIAGTTHYPSAITCSSVKQPKCSCGDTAIVRAPEIKGVFSHNDETVRGVGSALRQTGKLVPPGKPGHIYIVGPDGTPLALSRIRGGTQDASIGQDPIAMGGNILDAVISDFEGKPFPKSTSIEPVLIKNLMLMTPSSGVISAKKNKVYSDGNTGINGPVLPPSKEIQ